MKKSHANNRTPLLAGLWALALIGVLALPQTANAQGGPLSTIDQKVGDIQDTLGPVPAPGSDVHLQIDALRQQNDLILKLLCGNPNTPQQFCEKKVFVTSTVHINGNLAGLQGADDICNSLASSAELPRTYKAWLSDDAASPNTRFAKSTEPYVLVDGTLVASSYADLTDGSL